MSQLSLFISCVSNEFGHYRDALRRDLSRPNVTTKIQEDFIPYGAATLQKLDDYIKQCDAVIHLCGDMTGSMANDFSLEYINNVYKDFGSRFSELLPVLKGTEQLSYTQWEAWLAAYHKKILLIAKPQDAAPRHSLYQNDTEQKQRQQMHLSRLRNSGRYDEILFNTPDELSKNILRSSLLDLLSKVGSAKPISLPYHSIGSLFKGRENEVAKIFGEFNKVHSKPTAIIGNTIHGLGGIGKTRLAVEYARRLENEYSALLFVTADSPEKLFGNLAALSAQPVLDLPEQHAQEEKLKYDAVLKWFNEHSGWLLILDNADSEAAANEVEKLFSKLRGGHVLITSRRSSWSSQVNSLQLDVLNEDASVSFLIERTAEKRRTETNDKSIAAVISEDLGYLALALEQAGAYINTRRLSFAQYREAWQTNNGRVLEWFNARLMTYPSSVAVTWQTSISQLSPEAKLLLDRLAWLAPDPIPEALLEVKAGEGDVDNYTALSELADYSLVNRFDTPQFSIHRLVQDVTRRKQDKEAAQKIIVDCINWIDQAFQGDPTHVTNWPVLEPLISHARAVTSHSENDVSNTLTKSRLLNQVGLFFTTKAQYAEAERPLRLALHLDEHRVGKDHPMVALRLNNLASLLMTINRLKEAEELIRRAILIDEQTYGDVHAYVARDLSTLGQMLKATNRLNEAEKLMRRVLQISEQVFGENHSNVARDLNNLATLLMVGNHFGEAETLLLRALKIDEQSLGENHPRVATRLNNLAQLFRATNRLEEAETLLLRALKIDEQNFGETHPNVAITLNNLAGLFKDTNRLEKAEQLMRRALQIDEQRFGENHPKVARDLNNLAQLLELKKQYEEAELLMQRSRRIDQYNSGEKTPM